MQYNILGTGSSGNCIIVNDNIMLDCGLSYSKIKKYLKNIKLIFISHKHTDHLLPTTIKQIAYNYPTIKFVYNIEDMQITNILVSNGILPKNCYGILQDSWFNLGICKIKLNELCHDVLNSACHLEINGKRLLYVTDTSSIPFDAKNYDNYLIEANYHSKEELEKKIQEAEEKGEFTHLKRVLYTHLCEEDCIDWLKENMGDNSEYQFIHQHIDKDIEKGEENEIITM